MSIEHHEGYIDQLRSLIEVNGLEAEFVVDPLVIDGAKIEKRLYDMGADLGAIGSKMEEDGMIQNLDIPVDDDGVYKLNDANVVASMLSDAQVSAIGFMPLPGQRFGVIENKEAKKSVFFRIPETEVCELFPCVFIDDKDRDEKIELVVNSKDELNKVGDEVLRLGRIIYGVWFDSLRSGDFVALDKLMGKVYGEKLVNDVTIDSVYGSLTFALTQEADRPADNWWLALCAVRKTLEILDKDSYSYQPKAISEVRKIVIEIAYKCFYPEMLYKFVVEPLSKINYAGGEKLLENEEMREIESRISSFLVQKKTAA